MFIKCIYQDVIAYIFYRHICMSVTMVTDINTHVFPTQGGPTAFTIDVGDCMQSGQQNPFFGWSTSDVHAAQGEQTQINIYLFSLKGKNLMCTYITAYQTLKNVNVHITRLDIIILYRSTKLQNATPRRNNIIIVFGFDFNTRKKNVYIGMLSLKIIKYYYTYTELKRYALP